MIKNQKYLIASACLCGFQCRYDGKSKPNKKIIDVNYPAAETAGRLASQLEEL